MLVYSKQIGTVIVWSEMCLITVVIKVCERKQVVVIKWCFNIRNRDAMFGSSESLCGFNLYVWNTHGLYCSVVRWTSSCWDYAKPSRGVSIYFYSKGFLLQLVLSGVGTDTSSLALVYMWFGILWFRFGNYLLAFVVVGLNKDSFFIQVWMYK